MLKDRLVSLLGTLFVGSLLAAAQSNGPPATPAPEHFAPAVEPANSSLRLSAIHCSLARSAETGTPRFHFSPAGTYNWDRSLPPLQTLRTPFLRQSRMTVVQLWGGRLRLDSFETVRRMDNTLRTSSGFHLGASAAPAMALGSDRLYGFSLSLHPGAKGRSVRAVEGCHCLGWLLSPLTK